MPAIHEQSRIRRRPDLLAVDINGEVVTLNAVLGEYYSLNAIASDIWRRLENDVVVQALLDELTQDYEGDPAVIRADVIELLDTFAGKGLLAVEE